MSFLTHHWLNAASYGVRARKLTDDENFEFAMTKNETTSTEFS